MKWTRVGLLASAIVAVALLGSVRPSHAYGELVDVTLKITPNTTGAKATWVTEFTIPADTDVGHMLGSISGNPLDFSGASAVVTGLPEGYEIILKPRTTCASGCDDFRLWYQNPVRVAGGTRVTITLNNVGNPGTNQTGWNYFDVFDSKYPTMHLGYLVTYQYVPLVEPAPSCSADTWTCGSWSVCSSAGSQTRLCSLSFDCSTASTPKPATSQSCTPPPAYPVPETDTLPPTTPSCNVDTWGCSAWSACSPTGRQTRNCSKTYDCPTAENPAPEVSQNCPASTTPATICTSDTWTCLEWSICSDSDRQTRNCSKTYDCPSAETPSPEVIQTCMAPSAPIAPTSPTPPAASAPNEPTCSADTWVCAEWETCSLSGVQGRSCTRTFNCPNAETPPPATYQYCEAPVQPKPVEPNSPDAAANQDTIIKATVKLVCPVDETMASQGSGTVMNSNGTIITNRHVIDQTAGCFVGFITNYSDEPYFNERQIADIVAVSTDQDIAVLKMHNPPNQPLPYIDITTGQSSNLALGSKITTYGYPAKFGTTLTYTSGDFSGIIPGFLKTTAIIEHGNSGGGAYTHNGTFVGMPTAVVKGELNALGYILASDNINAWLNNRPVAYNPGTDNNYSRVRQILESYSVKELPVLKLAIPAQKPSSPAKKSKAQAAPDKVKPMKQAAEEQKIQSEKFKEIKNNPAPNTGAAQAGPRESWFWRLIRWIKSLF